MIHKKTSSLLAALLLVAAGATPSGAGRAGPRVEEKPYSAGTAGAQNVGGACPHSSLSWDACYLVFFAAKGERSFRVEMFDDVSPTPMVRVYQDYDHDGMTDVQHDVCGSSGRIRTRPYARISMLIWGHPFSDPGSDDSCIGNSTSGIVRVTFYR